MQKVVYLVNRKAGTAFDAFRTHQLDIHVPLATRLPGLKRYELDLFPPVDGHDQPYDAMATVWFEDRAAHDAALASPEGQAAVADLARFLDTDRMVVIFGETAISEAF